MSYKENIYKFFKLYASETMIIFTTVVVVIFAIKTNIYADQNLVVGKFVNVALAGLSTASNLIALVAVLVSGDDKWGDMKEFRPFIAIGSLIGLIASLVSLLQFF